MKANMIKTFLFAGLTAGMLSSCVNDDDYAIPSLECVDTTLSANKQVNDVTGAATAIPKQYIDNDVIEAYVTSSDEGGNFFKSISMVSTDGKYGFSVPVDLSSTFISFEPGRKVYIKLQGLYTDAYQGSSRIGALYVSPTSGTASVGRMDAALYKKSLIRSCTVIDEETITNHLTVAEAKNDMYLNKIVELDAVQFTDDALGRNYYDSAHDVGGATNWLLVDAAGNSIIFRTSSYSNFANKPVPDGNGKVRGVLTKYGSDYQFLARTEADIKLTNPRSVPAFEESFTSNFPQWTKFSVTGAQVWTLDTQYGNPGSCAKMSGYASGNQNNEDWLISPSISLSGLTGATLFFDTATKFAGNALEVLISTNYTGTGAPSAATWTPLTGYTLSPATGSYVWTGSGPLDITAYAGQNIHVAFKYTSTTAAAATWEVDNVKVVGN